MKRLMLLALAILCSAPIACGQSEARINNPAIDMQGYLAIAAEAAKHRQWHRLTEDDFIRMSHEPGTIILDACSREKYKELHIKGATYLSFQDITADRLKRTSP